MGQLIRWAVWAAAAGVALGQTYILHIPVTGQSLAQGAGGTPTLTTSSPPAEATWAAGVKNYWSSYGGTWGNFIAGSNEQPSLAALNMLTELSPGKAQRHSTYNSGTSSGQPYSVLKKAAAACACGGVYEGCGNYACPYDAMMHDALQARTFAAASGWTAKSPASMVVHGETDFYNHVSAAAYAGYMVEWQRDIQNDMRVLLAASKAVPQFHTQLSAWTYYGHATPTTGTGAAGVPLGQWWAARDNPGQIYLVGPKYQYAYTADGMHLTNTAYRALGSLYAKAMHRVLDANQRWIPLAPRAITRSGAAITLRLWVPAGQVAIDTSIVPAQTNYGFEFWDNSGSPPAVTGVTVTGTDTLQITLAAVPSGTDQRLRYAYTGTAGAKAGTNNGQNYARGNIRDTDPATDLWGNALYDWLITFDEPAGFAWEPELRMRTAGRVQSSRVQIR